MSRLRVISAGLSSIQDLGRFGLQRYGIPPAGAMDIASLGLGNALVGCARGTAAIETGPLPSIFETEGPPIRIAVTGAARSLAVDGEKAGFNCTHLIHAGQRITLGSVRGGMYSYLCLEGGLVTEPQYASSSLDERSGFGSPYCRRLQSGDVLEARPATAWKSEQFAAENHAERSKQGPIRIILGPQDDYFYPETIRQFLTTQWRIATDSNRMCYSLDGPLLAHARGYNIVSDGTVKGSIQIAGSGQPFVLLSDRGTIGGYPKIATLATVDIDRFTQIPPGGTVSFEAISVERAQALLHQERLHRKPFRLRQAPRGATIDEAVLASANIAGHAMNALEPPWHD